VGSTGEGYLENRLFLWHSTVVFVLFNLEVKLKQTRM